MSKTLLALTLSGWIAACAPHPQPPLPDTQPSASPTPSSSTSPLPSDSPVNNPCPNFHLDPINLDLPVETIETLSEEIQGICNNPVSQELYLLTKTKVMGFNPKTNHIQQVLQNSPAFKDLKYCVVDAQQNVYLTDSASDRIYRYDFKTKGFTALSSQVNRYTKVEKPGQSFIHLSPKQELYVVDRAGKIFYYTQTQALKALDIRYGENINQKFDGYSQRLKLAERDVNNKENIVFLNPIDITFDDQNMYLSDASLEELFKINPQGIVSTLPSVTQRGKQAFLDTANPALGYSFFLYFSPRFNVIFQGRSAPLWISPESGCAQQLSNNISPRGLAEGSDGHLYLIDAKRKLARIKLSEDLFK